MFHAAARWNCERKYVPKKSVYTGKASTATASEVEKRTRLFAPGYFFQALSFYDFMESGMELQPRFQKTLIGHRDVEGNASLLTSPGWVLIYIFKESDLQPTFLLTVMSAL